MRRSQVPVKYRGGSRFKTIVWLVIFGSMVYVGIRVVPILYNEYLFTDAMQTAARFGSANRQSVDDIRKAVVTEAKTDDIPVQPEDIHIESAGGNVQISTSYSVTVDLQVYQWTLNFHPTASNNAL
jgi:Domain of unknown function (DUF4845)